jgi:hypothetical protein
MRAFQAAVEWQEYRNLLLEVTGDGMDNPRQDAVIPGSKPARKKRH